MVWLAFIYCVLFSLHFVSYRCEGAITSPPDGEEYLFLPGETEKIEWEIDDFVSALALRSWSYRSSKGATPRSLARIFVDGPTVPQTNFLNFTIERPATLVLNNVNQSYNGLYTFSYVASAAFLSQVVVSIANRNEVNEGNNFTCECRGVGGNPPANVTWFKGVVQISETKNENNTLNLYDVNATDSGTYKCIAQSYPTEAFKDEKSMELAVRVNAKTFSDDDSCGTEWYIVVVSLVFGIIIGIIFSYIVWCSHRRRFRNRKPERNLEPQPTEVNTTYQELDLTRMNPEDNYQSLRVNAASNVVGNDDDSTYTELSKTRDVENSYQSLT